jgi:hypothetical protein
MDPAQADDMAPPPGTAVVRPLRHVRAVRERYLQRFTDPAAATSSRSALAWAWALSETATSPVTDRTTAVPPSRPEIEAEITVADERRLRGDQENRADAAAAILRWLIGDDDHIPVLGENRGELVGGFGDVVRSQEQIVNILARATEGQQRATARGRDVDTEPRDQQVPWQQAEYLGGVIATLAWLLGRRAYAPITHKQTRHLTSTDLKSERLHAEDVEQIIYASKENQQPSRGYAAGVKLSIAWLLGDQVVPPI